MWYENGVYGTDGTVRTVQRRAKEAVQVNSSHRDSTPGRKRTTVIILCRQVVEPLGTLNCIRAQINKQL